MMMASSSSSSSTSSLAPTTVIHVAGGTAASPLSSPTLSPPRSSRLRSREPSDGDDEPLLPPPLSPGASVASRLGVSMRMRRCLSRIRHSRFACSTPKLFSGSGGASWIVKGLCICLGMMLMGGVGSFTLHQLMSPQIESLLRQRNELQQQMEALRDQVANQTRIAESRLEMIHLLEKELEKQVVAAASATAAVIAPSGDSQRRPSPHFASIAFKANFWTTLVYAGILGSFVLAVVALRVYQIARTETQRTLKARASSDSDSFPRLSSHVALSMDDPLGEGKTVAAASRNAECYKRAPGTAPQDRLVHV